MLRQSRLVLCGLAMVFVAAGLASATTYTVTDLGVLAGGTQSYAMAVNDSGTVVGSSRTGAGTASFRATIYTGGAWVNIGRTVNNTYGTFATGINNNGQVALWLRGRGATLIDSFIYSGGTGGTYTDIGAKPGVCNGVANRPGYDTYQAGNYHGPGAINSSGKTAGWYMPTADSSGSFVWNGSSTTAVTTPASGGIGQDYASSINDNGVVVGWYQVGINPVGVGYYNDGTEHDISNGTYPECIAGNYAVGENYYNNHAFVYTLGAGQCDRHRRTQRRHLQHRVRCEQQWEGRWRQQRRNQLPLLYLHHRRRDAQPQHPRDRHQPV